MLMVVGPSAFCRGIGCDGGGECAVVASAVLLLVRVDVLVSAVGEHCWCSRQCVLAI